MAQSQRADQDSPWKDALEQFLPAFMLLYFPAAHRRIDWDRQVAFLDKELQRIRPRGQKGRRTVDKLVQVHLREGGDAWILVHIEVQGDPETEFPERMYVYSYRAYDKYGRPVASFGILADRRARWRPRRFRSEVLGCEVSLRFPVVKLLDFRKRRRELEESDNPAAVFTLAALTVLETSEGSPERLAAKLHAVRRLRDMGLSQEDREKLFRLVDWIVELSEDLQLEFDDEIDREEEAGTMPFVTSVERRAAKRGLEQGLEQGRRQWGILMLTRQLERKFGMLPEDVRTRVGEADPETLLAWGERAVVVERLEDVFA